MSAASPPHVVRAVLFDLIGTLTTAVSSRQRKDGHRLVADALGAKPETYLSVLLDTYVERASGRHGSMEQTMRWVARRAGTHPSDARLARACALRRAVERRHLRFRDDAVRVLATLRAAGVRTGVVSDCTHEIPALWPSLPLSPHVDATVFSIEIGRCKPDSQVYATACRRLAIPPGGCVYVGDGGSRELSGARATGMYAIRLTAPDSGHHMAHCPEPGWRGPQIRSLSDLLPMVTERDTSARSAWIPRQRTLPDGGTPMPANHPAASHEARLSQHGGTPRVERGIRNCRLNETNRRLSERGPIAT